ncbi:hypothetical protein BV97_02706 [Novosphingobium resinovorum]|uniref:KAP NTPase domain-containing protein n=1 Tax=Novosphingobium resinovorum TaxID=158500 RepID=A0A031JXG7_9SPHN|nr:hypothetical protein [Novosphingobium resinovorum]EZP81488.1 hypothetical protein BV97_02706 [Novosphingobium resinovorum]
MKMTQKSTDGRLAINLDNEATFEITSTLQGEASTELAKLIAAQLIGSDGTYKDVKPTAITYPRPHRAILVEGGRGSGKTTFLLGHLQSLAKKSDMGGEWEKISDKVHVLPMVDPTLIEAKDNIIIIIIQMIEAAIDGLDKPDERDLDKLDKAREALAEGLNLLDGIGSDRPYGEQWEGASWVMSEGLRKARKGRNFELKFNLYLETALEILKKSAFVLAFDDVDTNFKHGHLILETLRKYLTSPRLIIILSGDLDLYGRLIRAHIYETFGDKVLRHDADITQSQGVGIKDAVRELEEQYLLKVVPPQNRIRMLPLGGLKKARDIVVQSRRSNSDSQRLPNWIASRVRAILGEPKSTDHPFVEAIWREHIRLVISYLRALDLAIDESSEVQSDDGEPESLRGSRSAVLKVFETRLRMAGVRSDLLDLHSFDMTLRTTFDWLVKQREPATLAQFSTPANLEDAIVLHCLALALAQGLENTGNDLKALLTLLLPAMMLQRPDLADDITKKKVFAYLANQATPLLTETAARIGAVGRFRQEKALTKQPASSFGSVGVAGRSSLVLRTALKRVYSFGPGKGKYDVTIEGIKNASMVRSSAAWMQTLHLHDINLQPEFGVVWFAVEEIIAQQRCGKFSDILELVFSRRFNERGEIFQSISALSILSIIAELLLHDSWPGLDGLSVQGIIPSFDRANTNSAATSSSGQTTNDGDGESEHEDTDDTGEANDTAETSETDSEVETSYRVFLDHMKAWHAFAVRLAGREKLSPSMLGGIAARIHDDLIDLDAAVPQKWGTGDILHRQITNILNAFVYETAVTKGRKESPKATDLALIKALNRNPTGLHPVAVILLSCPLVWAFLQTQEDGGADLALAANVALNEWSINCLPDEEQEKFSLEWLMPPYLEVEIGRGGPRKRSKVSVYGFYDLLNVVPRYADDN